MYLIMIKNMKLVIIESFEQFKNYLNDNQYDFIIINVSASWCKPCNAIKEDFSNYINSLQKENSICLKIDYDLMKKEYEFHEILNVEKIPYFLIFHLKNKIDQIQSSSMDLIINKIENTINQQIQKSFDINEDF